MSSTQQLLLAEGGGGAAPNYIEDVFSTYLYTGNGTSQTITNNIDLSTKGGLVWIKNRTTAYKHVLTDTARGVNKQLASDNTDAQATETNRLTAFTTSGFTVSSGDDVNSNTNAIASWTFRKQPKFFDIVTYTGNGTSGRAISHNLGSTPGCIFAKKTSAAEDWRVYHRSLGASYQAVLNNTGEFYLNTDAWGGVAPTSTQFTVSLDNNANGETYVAYLYAHNAGGFGLTGTDNVISCGSFTTDANGIGSANLGYEPQFLIAKRSSNSGDWNMFDNMRGMPVSADQRVLLANSSGAEFGSYRIALNATGFTTDQFSANSTYIYIAIRRGPMKVPTDATKVFTPVTDVSSTTDIAVSTTNQVDMIWSQPVTSVGGDNESFAFDRLRGVSTTVGTRLKLNSTAAEASPTGLGMGIAQNTGYIDNWFYNQGFISRTIANWTFKRAPSFFDEVCYTGTGSATTVTHNLGAVPELLIVKSRSGSGSWRVWNTSLTQTYDNNIRLNSDAAQAASGFPLWADSGAPSMTSTTFSLGSSSGGQTNDSGVTMVAYLFATCAGVSKVGSYTGNGSTQAIACGFTGGARFVLIKRTDSTGNWYVYDTARGMTTLTNPYLLLNFQSSQVATLGSVTTTTGGFTVDASILAAINTNGASYIYLSIA